MNYFNCIKRYFQNPWQTYADFLNGFTEGVNKSPKEKKKSTKTAYSLLETTISVLKTPQYKSLSEPCFGQLTIEYVFSELPKDAILQITDIIGHFVYSQKIVQKQGQIIVPTAELPAGLYLVNVQSAHQTLWQSKISVQH